MTEVIDILTPGGTVSINATAAIKEGHIECDTDSAGDLMKAVRAAINNEISLPTPDGGQVLISKPIIMGRDGTYSPPVVIAMTYRRT